MRHILKGSLLFCFVMASAINGYAQEEYKAKKMENHTWHQVVLVKFTPGMADSAMKIIDNHFMKAGMNMDSDMPGPQIMQLRSGEWDMLMVWTMKGIEDLDWEISPDDEKWWAAMVEQEGSMEKATKIMQDYMSLIANSTSYLATTRNNMPGDAMGSKN